MKFIEDYDVGKVCLKCLSKKENIHEILYGPLTYGSLFDEVQYHLYLCDDCYRNTPSCIVNPKEMPNDEFDDFKFEGKVFYRYEDEEKIMEYLENLPIAGQEIVFNRTKTDYAFPLDRINPIDWIETYKKLKEKHNENP